MGYLYRPTLKSGELGTIWHVQYFVNGRRVRESTRTPKKSEAERFLKSREGHVVEGRPILPRVDRISYDELAADLRQHYETSGDRELKEADKRLAPLAAFFSGRRGAEITSADVTAYVARRQAEKKANGTINRELSMLGRVLRFATEQDPPKLLRVPLLRLLKEASPRAGFFESHQYEAVRRHLRPDLQVIVALAYAFGWRVRDEVLTLERRQVDLPAGTIRLDPGQTKNDDGRLVYLPAPCPEGRVRRAARARPRPGAPDRPGRSLRLPAPHGSAPGPAAPGLQARLEDSLQARRLPRDVPARLPPDRHPEHGE